MFKYGSLWMYQGGSIRKATREEVFRGTIEFYKPFLQHHHIFRKKDKRVYRCALCGFKLLDPK